MAFETRRARTGGARLRASQPPGLLPREAEVHRRPHAAPFAVSTALSFASRVNGVYATSTQHDSSGPPMVFPLQRFSTMENAGEPFSVIFNFPDCGMSVLPSRNHVAEYCWTNP